MSAREHLAALVDNYDAGTPTRAKPGQLYAGVRYLLEREAEREATPHSAGGVPTCTCATTYATYQGPEEDCPRHGRPCCIDGDTPHPHTPPSAVPVDEEPPVHYATENRVHEEPNLAPTSPPAPAQVEAAVEALARDYFGADYAPPPFPEEHLPAFVAFRAGVRAAWRAIPGYGPTGAGCVCRNCCGSATAEACAGWHPPVPA